MYLRTIFERGGNKNGDKNPKLSSLLKPAAESGETITITPFHALWACRDALRMRESGRGCPHKKRRRNTPAKHTGGDDGDRTHDLRLAKPALSQLSYVPFSNKRPSGDSAHAGAFICKKVVGPTRFELVTSRLSAGRSDQLSYGPTCGASFTSRLAIISQPNAIGQQKFKKL